MKSPDQILKSVPPVVRLVCSNNLVHWTDWQGKNLIVPSEVYDAAENKKQPEVTGANSAD